MRVARRRQQGLSLLFLRASRLGLYAFGRCVGHLRDHGPRHQSWRHAAAPDATTHAAAAIAWRHHGQCEGVVGLDASHLCRRDSSSVSGREWEAWR